CILIIMDTIAPTGQAVPIRLELGEECGPEDFVENISDATAVEVTYAGAPDFARAGSQVVQVALTDRGGNRTVVESELFISAVAEDLTVEAGCAPPDVSSFLLGEAKGEFVTRVADLDYHKTGDHAVVIRVDGEDYTSRLHIRDTIPPQAEVHDIEGFAVLPRPAEDFVTTVEDATAVTMAFREEPDLLLAGTQQVEIVFTDEGGNETVKTAKLTLVEDVEPPVIQGTQDLLIYVGDSISYRKNVTVEDNCPEGLQLTVDTGSVNLKEAGVYPVIYTAVDAAGNTTSVTVQLTVIARMYSIEEVNALADAVLEGIITPDMSDRDKAWAIYTYIRRNVGYINHSEKGDWARAAYEGLVKHQGDCYVYACTAKALLTRAGIKNMDIAKIPTRLQHFWNLVDVGDGWYHFDTTPRSDHTVFFLWTDAELMEYSNAHYRCHNYDPELYPEIN
ncbi:MAG: transglutaminase, partial [Acetatifactor sp.]|nr:transglutaminase [Acetatifactor sp.]